jgi:hypothetical protein
MMTGDLASDLAFFPVALIIVVIVVLGVTKWLRLW